MADRCDTPPTDEEYRELKQAAFHSFLQSSGNFTSDEVYDGGVTPLHIFASMGLVPISILESGADINAKDVRGQTPIHNIGSVRQQSDEELVDLAKLLLRFGARIDMKPSVLESILINIAFSGAAGHRSDLILFLVRCGANVSSSFDCLNWAHIRSNCGHVSPTPLEVVLDHGADPNAFDPWSTTVLLEAADAGNTPCVHELLGSGAEVNTSTIFQRSVLKSLSLRGSLGQHITKVLLQVRHPIIL